jgi:hypothetical protein
MWTAERGRRLGKHKHRWENNIKVDLKEIESDSEYLIYRCHDKEESAGDREQGIYACWEEVVETLNFSVFFKKQLYSPIQTFIS